MEDIEEVKEQRRERRMTILELDLSQMENSEQHTTQTLLNPNNSSFIFQE